MVLTPEPGIYPGVPSSEYQQWCAVNDSFLSILINRSPAHAKAYKEQPQEPTEALIVGNALHTRVLEPSLFPSRYAVRPVCDRRTKEGKAMYEGFAETLDDRQELTDEQVAKINRMALSLEQHSFHRYIEQGQFEVCIVWRDRKTDLLCKARLDYWQEALSVIVDLKTCRDASFDAFGLAVYRYQYYQKAAWYCDGLKTLTKGSPSFVFMALEKEPPYACAAYQLADDAIVGGRKAYRRALSIYQECVATNYWPGYSDRIEILTLPEWAMNRLGVGQYNLIREDEQNEQNDEPQDKQFSSGTIDTDWDELERDARQSD